MFSETCSGAICQLQCLSPAEGISSDLLAAASNMVLDLRVYYQVANCIPKSHVYYSGRRPTDWFLGGRDPPGQNRILDHIKSVSRFAHNWPTMRELEVLVSACVFFKIVKRCLLSFFIMSIQTIVVIARHVFVSLHLFFWACQNRFALGNHELKTLRPPDPSW